MFKKRIPNLLTLSNLSLGVLSILEIIKCNFYLSAIFIIAAAIIDRYDGKIARALNVSSDLGKELDSLADLVSFGVAPALLIFNKFDYFYLGRIEMFSVCFLLVYILCGSYRLAKYNINEFNGVFTGIPITFAGSIIAAYSLVVSSNSFSRLLSIILLLILSYLMVSRLKFKKI